MCIYFIGYSFVLCCDLVLLMVGWEGRKSVGCICIYLYRYTDTHSIYSSNVFHVVNVKVQFFSPCIRSESRQRNR